MAREVAHGGQQVVLRQGGDAAAGLGFLRGADLHHEVAPRGEVVPGLADETGEDFVPVGTAVQGQVGLVVAHARWEGGQVRPDEEVVVFNTGAAQKYPEAVPLDLPRLDKDRPVDYAALVGARS